MLSKTQWMIVAAAVGVLTVLATTVSVLNTNSSDSDGLVQLRQMVEEMIAQQESARRVVQARESFVYAESLLEQDNPIGSTARLYLISLAPIARKNASDLQVPEADLVREMDSADLLLLSQLLYFTERYNPADQLLDLLISRDNIDRETVLRLAITVRYDIGRDQDVLNHCQELLKSHPDDAGLYRIIAMVHRNHGRWEHFVDHAEQALERMTPPEEVLRIELVQGYVKLGRTSDARLHWDIAERNAPKLTARAPTVHAELLVQEGDNKKAEVVLDQYLDQQVDSEALVILGKLLNSQARFSEAIPPLEKAVKMEPSSEDAHYQLGQAHARMGHKDQAERHLGIHQKLLDQKVRLHQLEQQAAREPYNVAVRREIAESYEKIGLPELSEFWRRTTAGDEEPGKQSAQ